MASLESAWLKVHRGREHIEAAQKLVDDWLGTDAYTIGSEVDPETGDTVRRAQIQSRPPQRISLLIGDGIQNLRSALDHAIYALAEARLGPLAPEIEELLMFPIVGNQNSKGQPAEGSKIFKEAVRRGRLRGVSDDAIAFVQQEQPYHWDPGFDFHWLWVIHELNRIDKHRRLALTTAFLDFQFISIPDGVDPRASFTRAEGPVKDGDVLVTYSGADVGVDAHFTRAVAVDEGSMAGYTIDRLLTPVRERVEWMLLVLQGFL